MERSWFVRLGMVLGIVLVALYLLIPTWVYFRLPPDVRNDKEAFEKALPSWVPHKRVNLGLDLQGGVHLVLGVDLDKAVKDKVVRRADEMKRWAGEKTLTFQSIKALPEDKELSITFANDADAETFRKAALDYWGDMSLASGGVNTRMEFQKSWLDNFKSTALDQALRTVRNRIDKWGVSEPTIQKTGGNGILVQLPGFKDPEKAKELLGRTAQLEFKMLADEEGRDLVKSQPFQPLPQGVTVGNDGYQAYLQAADRQELEKFVTGKAPEGQEIAIGTIEHPTETGLPGGPSSYRTYVLKSKTELTGDKLTDAQVRLDSSGLGGGMPYVSLTFDAEGARMFEEITGANVHKRMAIVLDGTVNSAPVIQARIAGGNAQITMGGGRNYNQTLESAKDLSLVLRSGALPAPVSILEERSVGASLGPELIRKGSISVLLGVALVMLFMAIYYRLTGLIADVALFLNGLLILAGLVLVGATLTLPGLAGFVLTLGMAVDANVLINERIREELREGRTPKNAVSHGYGKAFWTIFDTHLTTLIASVILFYQGTGPVRGFAVTLIIGLMASMFTSIVVTRLFVDRIIRGRPGEAISV